MKLYNVVSSNPSIIWVNTDIIQEKLSTDSFNENYLKWKERCIINNWFVMKKIREISKEINIGFTSKRNYQSVGIKFLNISNIKQFSFKFDSIKFISKEVHEKLKKSQLKQGDVLLTITGTIGDSVVVPNNFGEANISANIVTIRLHRNYDPYYLSVFFNSKYGKLQTKGSSKSNVWSNLGVQQVKDIEIPIPSCEIQKYIGDKVRKAEELREEAKRLKKEAEGILITEIYINQILEESNSINKKYMWVKNCDVESRIDSEYYNPEYLHYKEILKNNNVNLIKINEISESIKTGTTPKSECLTEEVQKVLFLRVNNIEDSIINKKDILYLKNNYNGQKIKYINKNDILVSIAGTIGRSAVIDFENCITNQNVASITLKNSCNINPYYLSMYMNSYMGKLSLERTATQATVKYINNELLGNIEIPVINLERQKELEKKVLEYKYKKEKSEQLIEEAKHDVEDLIEGNFDTSKLN